MPSHAAWTCDGAGEARTKNAEWMEEGSARVVGVDRGVEREVSRPFSESLPEPMAEKDL